MGEKLKESSRGKYKGKIKDVPGGGFITPKRSRLFDWLKEELKEKLKKLDIFNRPDPYGRPPRKIEV